jgi:hypothetical protein
LTSDHAPTDADYESHIETLKKWIAASPQSATAQISLAALYADYASFARGTGYANTVSRSQWELFYQRTALAKHILLDAAHLKDRDPYWYYVMQCVAHNEGWKKAQARELLDQAIAFEPGYYHFYRLYATYLLPQWYGQPGDIPAFADEISAKTAEPDSSIYYFQIVSSLACDCQEAVAELPNVDYPRVRQGYANLTSLYGTSNLTANRFAYFASSFKDQSSAREAFTAVEKMEPNVWLVKNDYDSARQWAGVP